MGSAHNKAQNRHAGHIRRPTSEKCVATSTGVGEKATISNFELWDDRSFPECPLQLRKPENQPAPGTIWTGDIPEAWLEEPDIQEDERRAKDLVQEQQRYLQNPRQYKSLKHVDRILAETGHRGIRAVRLQDSTVTNDPNVVIEELLHGFKRLHNAEDGELSDYTKHLISHLPQVYNQTKRRDVHRTPFTIREWDEVLHKLKPGKTQGVDGLPDELYRGLPLHLKRHLAARLWDIAIRRADIPPDWGNLVHPLYKKGEGHTRIPGGPSCVPPQPMILAAVCS